MVMSFLDSGPAVKLTKCTELEDVDYVQFPVHGMFIANDELLESKIVEKYASLYEQAKTDLILGAELREDLQDVAYAARGRGTFQDILKRDKYWSEHLQDAVKCAQKDFQEKCNMHKKLKEEQDSNDYETTVLARSKHRNGRAKTIAKEHGELVKGIHAYLGESTSDHED
jgi:hypothetical protein